MSAGVLTMMRPRADRSLRLGVVVGAVVCAAALGGAALVASQSGGSSAPAVDHAKRSALVEWERSVRPLISSAGQVVALGPRTGIHDIGTRAEPDAKLHDMATGWESRLSTLRDEIAQLDAPPFISPAAVLLDRAMAGYVTASHDLVLATTARGARRTSLLDAAAAAGKNADHLYDDATAAIAQWRSRLGLSPDWSG